MKQINQTKTNFSIYICVSPQLWEVPALCPGTSAAKHHPHPEMVSDWTVIAAN
jgi:hypothetical protein